MPATLAQHAVSVPVANPVGDVHPHPVVYCRPVCRPGPLSSRAWVAIACMYRTRTGSPFMVLNMPYPWIPAAHATTRVYTCVHVYYPGIHMSIHYYAYTCIRTRVVCMAIHCALECTRACMHACMLAMGTRVHNTWVVACMGSLVSILTKYCNSTPGMLLYCNCDCQYCNIVNIAVPVSARIQKNSVTTRPNFEFILSR